MPGPLGSDTNNPVIDRGTSALTAMKPPQPTGMGVSDGDLKTNPEAADSTHKTDPAIEALNLSETAKKAAYELKKKHPSVTFTSGRRTKEEQASAMAGNVVSKRTWIKETYKQTKVRDECQKWVDDHPEKKTKPEIAEGLTSVLNGLHDAEVKLLSRHLSGDAFDVQPVDKDADKIKETINNLPGLDLFLDKEGGLVRWHAQF